MLKLRYAEDCKSAFSNSALRRIANSLFARPLASYLIAATDILGSCFVPPMRAQPLRLATCPVARRRACGRLR